MCLFADYFWVAFSKHLMDLLLFCNFWQIGIPWVQETIMKNEKRSHHLWKHIFWGHFFHPKKHLPQSNLMANQPTSPNLPSLRNMDLLAGLKGETQWLRSRPAAPRLTYQPRQIATAKGWEIWPLWDGHISSGIALQVSYQRRWGIWEIFKRCWAEVQLFKTRAPPKSSSKNTWGRGGFFWVIFSAAWVVKRVRWKTIFWVEDSLG